MNERCSAQVVALVVRGRIILREVRIQLKDTAPPHLLVELRLIVGIVERLIFFITAKVCVIIIFAIPIVKLVTVVDILTKSPPFAAAFNCLTSTSWSDAMVE